VQRNESACHIFVLPDDEAGILTDMRLSPIAYREWAKAKAPTAA